MIPTLACVLPLAIVSVVWCYCVTNLAKQAKPGGPFVQVFPGRLIELHHFYWGLLLAAAVFAFGWPRELLLISLWFMTDDAVQHFEQLIRWLALPVATRLHVDPESTYSSPLNRFWHWVTVEL